MTSSWGKKKDAPVLEQALEKHLHKHPSQTPDASAPAETGSSVDPARFEKPWRDYWSGKLTDHKNSTWNLRRLFVGFWHRG